MKKNIVIMALTLLLMLCCGTAWAVEPLDVEAAAQELAAMGLFKGNGEDLALDSLCDRLQGAVLFTRLLGQEQEALATLRPHPFWDIAPDNWAAPYVGYVYYRGYSYGEAKNHYGSGSMRAAQFATFCLRALGYTEGSELSDFMWNESLDKMVEQGIISGNLRNRLRSTPIFTRGDAVLLCYASLGAEMQGEEGQTLLQYLVSSGALAAGQADSFSAVTADINIFAPQGLLNPAVMAALAPGGLSLEIKTYLPGQEQEEELYRTLREPGADYDICVVPGYLVERLRTDGLLRKFLVREFGGKETFVSLVRDNPYWFDEQNSDYYALPLAVDLPCLYYNSARVEKPDWGWMFRDNYSGGVYMPQDPALLLPLALHYYRLPYDTVEDRKLSPAISLLAEQVPAVPAYMQEHMLDIAEREGAVFGVISSRDLPELERRRQDNAAYANWQAVLPEAGAPASVYYAVIMQSADIKIAKPLLTELLQPQTAAANAMYGGYLPAVIGASNYLSGALAEAYPSTRWDSCRLLNLDEYSRSFYEQSMRNALLLHAQNTVQPELAALEFTFTSQGQSAPLRRVDLAELPAAKVKAFKKEAARLGLALWQEYYDGPANATSWEMTLTFVDGSTKTCGGQGLPLTWQDVGGALLQLCGEEIMPAALI